MQTHSPASTTARLLAQAIVDTLREPLLVLDKDLRVVAASRSFYLTFKVERQEVQGRPIYALGHGQWNIPDLRILLEEILPQHTVMEAYEVQHDFPGMGRRTMLLNARAVFTQSDVHSLILLTIEDVTDRRSAEQEMAAAAAEGNPAAGDAAPGRQQLANHRQHPSSQGAHRAFGRNPAAS